MRVRSTSGVCAALLLLGMACGSDSPAANGGNAAGSKAGASGAGGGGVPCGNKVCHPPAGYTGEVCCRDTFSGVCGQTNTAEGCQPFPAQTAPNCPDGTLVQSTGAMLVRGCCMANSDQCGLDLTGFSVYCSPLSDAQVFVDGTPDAGTLLPPPTNCDGTPGS